jgi:hypothetical protein
MILGEADPIRLPLAGRTDHDPNSLSKIRPGFDTLVAGDHVASSGPLILAQLHEDQQMVATGMPLK